MTQTLFYATLSFLCQLEKRHVCLSLIQLEHQWGSAEHSSCHKGAYLKMDRDASSSQLLEV